MYARASRPECSSHNGSYETRNKCVRSVAEPREAKGKGPTEKKNKQTNEETRQQQKEKKQCCAWRLVSSLLRDDTKNGCVADYGHWRASSERLEQASWY